MSSTQEVGDIFGAGKGPAQAMLRSPTVLIVSVGLWGMNVFFFQLFGINFKYVLNYDLMMEKQEQQQNQSHLQLVQHHQQEDAAGTSLTINDTGDDDDDFSGGSNANMDDQPSSKQDEAAAAEAAGGSITWYKLVVFSIALLILLHVTTHFWMDHLGRGVIGAVLFFYGAVLVYIFLPIAGNRWLQRSFVIVVQRVFALIYPRCSCLLLEAGKIPRAIPFVDVFFADAMCSLSKVLFDWGMLVHMATHYPDPVPQDIHNIVIPSLFAAIPFLIRARQCLIMHTVGKLKNDPKRYQHLANALKYSTSIFPLILSAYQKTVSSAHAKELEGFLILLLTINALYALYWDIVMDWGMMQNPTAVVQTACIGSIPGRERSAPSCHHVLLRPRLRFGLTMSSLIVLADTLLRFSWLLRFVATPFASNDAFVLCTQFLEVFRRAIWNLLRVEWENIKQKQKMLKARESLSDNEEDEHDEELSRLLRQQSPKALPVPIMAPGTTVTPRDSITTSLSSSSTTSSSNNSNKPGHTIKIARV